MIGANELGYSMVLDFVESYVRDYKDTSISTQEFCSLYHGGGIDNDCDGMEDDRMAGGTLILNALDDDSDGDGIYVAEIEVTQDGQTQTLEVEFEVFRQEFGPVQASRVEAVTPEIEVIEDLVIEWLGALENPDLSQDETCMYLHSESFEVCSEIYNYMMSNQVSLDLTLLEQGQYGVLLRIGVYDQDGSLLGTLEYDAYLRSDSTDNPLYIDKGTRTTNPLFE
jgi:hypothetical protein